MLYDERRMPRKTRKATAPCEIGATPAITEKKKKIQKSSDKVLAPLKNAHFTMRERYLPPVIPGLREEHVGSWTKKGVELEFFFRNYLILSLTLMLPNL